jgi:transcriptional regulator GlxA family with amidase domain
MLANLENPITIGDVAQAVGTSARSLQRSFAKYCDGTPKQFLTHARLDALHQKLQQGLECQTIADIMNQYQFSSFGRCSHHYRKRFGELPSETLRRSQNLPKL